MYTYRALQSTVMLLIYPKMSTTISRCASSILDLGTFGVQFESYPDLHNTLMAIAKDTASFTCDKLEHVLYDLLLVVYHKSYVYNCYDTVVMQEGALQHWLGTVCLSFLASIWQQALGLSSEETGLSGLDGHLIGVIDKGTYSKSALGMLLCSYMNSSDRKYARYGPLSSVLYTIAASLHGDVYMELVLDRVVSKSGSQLMSVWLESICLECNSARHDSALIERLKSTSAELARTGTRDASAVAKKLAVLSNLLSIAPVAYALPRNRATLLALP